MNKKLRVWFQLIILCLGVFLPFLAGTLKAQAAELNDVITEMHLTTNSGEQLTNVYISGRPSVSMLSVPCQTTKPMRVIRQ